MQLQDLPLLLAGALGAAITGMVAPGLSYLFGEIQKVITLLEYIILSFCSCRLTFFPKFNFVHLFAGGEFCHFVSCYLRKAILVTIEERGMNLALQKHMKHPRHMSKKIPLKIF